MSPCRREGKVQTGDAEEREREWGDLNGGENSDGFGESCRQGRKKKEYSMGGRRGRMKGTGRKLVSNI
jgi:hypothetical protein